MSHDDIKTRADWWRYHMDFFTFPALFFAVVIWDRANFGFAWIGAAVVGAFLFSFVEYWVHRVLLHGALYHGTHEDHHLEPEAHVFFPLYAVPSAFLGIWLAFAVVAGHVFGIHQWLAGFAGFVLGYIWFTLMHHALHHEPHVAGSYLDRFAKWHLVHHRGIKWNYGITTNIWDRLFRTYRAP